MSFLLATASSLAIAQFDSEQILNDLQFLSSDSLQGRGINTQGSALARAYLIERLIEEGVQPLDSSYTHEFAFVHSMLKKRIEGVNVQGLIRGSRNPERFIIVTAHYDHMGIMKGEIYNGADDNASGSVALLAIAEHLQKSPPANSVILACFDGEESGLAGSRRWVEECGIAHDSILLNINLDMISRSNKNQLYCCGTRHFPQFKSLFDKGEIDEKLDLRFGHEGGDKSDDWTYASDHANFYRAGIPFLYFGVEDHPDYHQPSDDFEKINQEFYLNVISAVIALIQGIDSE